MSEVPAPAAKARPAHVAGGAHAGLPKDIDADVVIEISKVLDGSPVFVLPTANGRRRRLLQEPIQQPIWPTGVLAGVLANG